MLLLLLNWRGCNKRLPWVLGKMLVYWKWWLLPDARMLVVSVRKARVLESAAACQQILAVVTLIVYYFVTSVVEHMVRCFAASCGLVFLLKFSSHFVVFAIFCEMSCVFTTNGTKGCSLASSSSSAFASAMGSSSSSPSVWRLIETSILLVQGWPLETLFRWVVLWLLLQIFR